MFILRKIGKIFRGVATPFQLTLACVLGALVGFMPGLAQAPGWIVLLAFLLALLNVNLFLAAVSGMVAALLSLVLMPVSFQIGRILLEGPTQGLFEAMINAPVLAFFGFEYYVVTGGLVVGLLVGLVFGWVVSRGITVFRHRMASLETGSDRYRAFTAKKWVRLLTTIFLGPGSKMTYEELLKVTRGKMLRPLGLALAVLLAVFLGVLAQFASAPIVTYALTTALERANGATVDLARAELSLRQGRLTLEGLAMADPNALDTDLFRAERIEAGVSTVNLLRKRVEIDRVVVTGGQQGEKRRVPGKHTRGAPEPREEKTPPEPGEKTLEDYLEQAEVWKERLAQARRWLERISGPGDEPPETTGVPAETRRERLERLREEQGYARLVAEHLLTGAPTVLITELRAEKVRVQAAQMEGETLDVIGRNLSTHPRLLEAAPQLEIRSSAGTLVLDISLAGASAARGSNRLKLAASGFPIDDFARQLTSRDPAPMAGGVFDFAGTGTFGGGGLDLPLVVTLHNTKLTLPGIGATDVEHFSVPLGLRGPLDSPRITLDDADIARSLAQAGKTALADRLRGEANERLGEEFGGPAGDLLRRLRPGGTDR